MDILTHTFSGFACGTVAASLYNGAIIDRTYIVLAGSIGGLIPDLDTVSLWSGFDDLFGSVVHGLPSGREIYFGKYWYSHHGFLHSLAAIIFIGVIFTLLRKCCRPSGSVFSGNHIFSLLGFSSGYLMHLLEDLPTPSGSWGGINLFWPYTKYYGGTGEIWWWNNYDIFLIVFSVCLINTILILLPKQFNNVKKMLPICVLFFGITLSVFQIKSRNYDFNHTTFEHKEQISLEKQKLILGDRIFEVMYFFDKTVGVHF